MKWLTHIHAVRQPFRGYWQTTDYGYRDYVDGMPVRRALSELKVKSEIARPCVYETLGPGRMYTISGTAWAGETGVTAIAVSADGGRTWIEAEVIDPIQRHAWRRWTCNWLTPERPGQYTLIARATSADGSVQPDTHDPAYGSYAINHSLPIEIFINDSIP